MLRTRLISTIASTALLATGIVGGIQGNLLADQNAAALNARENVSTLIAQNLAAVDYLAGVQARTLVESFQPTRDAAQALVESSASKASDAARGELAALLADYDLKVAQHFMTGVEFHETAAQIVATATPAIAAATQTVNDEIAAWQAAEDTRIAAEKAAAEEAAREASRSTSGSRNSTGSSGGSSNGNDGGSNNSGSGGSFRDWIESEAASWGVSVEYIDGSISYGMKNRIQIANVVADTGGDRAMQYVRHEIAHAIAYRDGNCMDAGLNTEVTAQYVSMKIWGFYVDVYRTPTAAENDALRAVCG